MIKPKVLFLCTANRCRTQMAEAFLRDLAGVQTAPPRAGCEMKFIGKLASFSKKTDRKGNTEWNLKKL